MIGLKKKVIAAIIDLVEEIYTLEQEKIAEKFMGLVDSLDKFITAMAEKGYSVDLTEDLSSIHYAYSNKDYVQLADLLLYELKPQFDELQLDSI